MMGCMTHSQVMNMCQDTCQHILAVASCLLLQVLPPAARATSRASTTVSGLGGAVHHTARWGTCWTRCGESAVGGGCVGTEGKWVGAKCGAVAQPAGAPAYSYTLRVEACGETDLLPTVQGS